MPEPAEPGPGHDDATVRRLALRHALAQLTPKQRAMIVLRFYEHRTEHETAQLMGVSRHRQEPDELRAVEAARAHPSGGVPVNTVREDLHALAEQAPAGDLAARAVRRPRRRRATRLAVAAAAVCVIAGGGGMLLHQERPSQWSAAC
ncbi:sigma factor-like helix-turn-helix DNA-binding protein [Nonomuraea sp. 10N515B]|uniref:sigma factor-like helix-turn-helix DNA-binding protein n=1 Tax=Nonomuraea sp. 10N515B TaxID=3457422 RepID=UPI003FCEC26A